MFSRVESSSGKVYRQKAENSVSADFEKCLKKKGVRHDLTIPNTPEQNGVAERMNRTLVEAGRSMLADSRLPHRFWTEALSTAVYLRNRSLQWKGRHLLKPGRDRNQMWDTLEFSDVPRMLMYLRTSVRNWMQNQGSVYF